MLRAPPNAGRVVLISEDDFRKNRLTRTQSRGCGQGTRRADRFSTRSDTGAWRLLGSKPFAIICRSHIVDNDDNNKSDHPIAKAMPAVIRLRWPAALSAAMSK